MKRPFGSFLIRYWLLDQSRHLIKVEHLQSKQETRLHSLAELMQWITDQMDKGVSQHGNMDEPSKHQDEEL